MSDCISKAFSVLLSRTSPSFQSENPVPSFRDTLVDKVLRKLPQSIGQFFWLASIETLCLRTDEVGPKEVLLHVNVAYSYWDAWQLLDPYLGVSSAVISHVDVTLREIFCGTISAQIAWKLDDSKAAPHEKGDLRTNVFLKLASRRIFDLKHVLGTNWQDRLKSLRCNKTQPYFLHLHDDTTTSCTHIHHRDGSLPQISLLCSLGFLKQI